MARLLFYLAVACVLCRWTTGRWPWTLAGLRMPWEQGGMPGRSAAVTRAQALLGVPDEASRSEILEAHKRLVAMVHPDRGGTSDQVHEANAARDLLLARLIPPGD